MARKKESKTKLQGEEQSKRLQQWKGKIRDAKKTRESADDTMDISLDYYRNKQWRKTSGYKELIVDNMIYSSVKTIVPSINIKNPRIYVKPTKKPFQTEDGMFDTNRGAAFVEVLANYHVKRLRMRRQVTKCLHDALLTPKGIMEIGYALETEKVKGDETIEPNELIRGDGVYVQRVSFRDFLILDPEADDHQLEDAWAVAKKWVKRLDDVKANPEYNNTSDLQPNFTMESKSMVVDEREAEDYQPDKMVEGWDIWDKKTKRKYVVVEDHTKFLQDKGWPLDIEGFPFEILYFNENPNEIEPLSDAEMNIHKQDELNKLRSLQIDHVESISKRRYIAKEGAFEDDELLKITDGKTGAIALTRLSVDKALAPVRDANVSQDLFIAIKSLKDSIREGDGVAQFEQGIAEKFDTATEPQLISQGVSIRRADRRDAIEDFYKRIVKKLMDILQQTMEPVDINLSPEQVDTVQRRAPGKLQQIVGLDGADTLSPWLRLDKKDILGDYEFEIEVGSTQPINQEIRKRDTMRLTELAIQLPDIDNRKWTKKILETFEIPDRDDLMKPAKQVAQEHQQAIQAQMAAKQAEVQPKIQADLQKTQMKSQTALQKTSMETKTNLGVALINASKKGEK